MGRAARREDGAAAGGRRPRRGRVRRGAAGHYAPALGRAPDAEYPVRTDVPPELAAWFDRYVRVFGVHIFTSESVDDWAMQVITPARHPGYAGCASSAQRSSARPRPWRRSTSRA